jgi:hypothetical protein
MRRIISLICALGLLYVSRSSAASEYSIAQVAPGDVVRGQTYHVAETILCLNVDAVIKLKEIRDTKDFETLSSGCSYGKLDTFIPSRMLQNLSMPEKMVKITPTGAEWCIDKRTEEKKRCDISITASSFIEGSTLRKSDNQWVRVYVEFAANIGLVDPP